jgi:ABC-type transport system involved in Fe-S cluster assembly fused permease/ATPase subunit
VAKTDKTELDGITLSVYWYVVKEGKPVGPRDVMKGAHLSSPSVAYRHLQKLEDMNLLQKNEYGEYMTKHKINIRGHVWIGRTLISKMMVYALVFLGILLLEIGVLVMHFEVEDYKFKIFFALLILVTGAAFGVFTTEGLIQRRRIKQNIQNE